MRLVDEIIDMASDAKQPLANVLRKCLILAFDLKNETLKQWTEKELNGFDRADEIPDYRKVALHSIGNFQGPAGGWIPNRPLPLGVLEKKHRDSLVVSRFVQPIATYDTAGRSGPAQNAVINWPPDLIAIYQDKFIEMYALAQAWQEVPAAVMVALCEEVRNRVLRFALEIRDELERVGDKRAAVPAETVQAAVVNYIYGGTNVIAGTAKDFSQVVSIVVAKGDFQGLENALKDLDITDHDIGHLRRAIEGDSKGKKKEIGAKTQDWLKNLGGKLGDAGKKIGTGVAQEVAKQWLLQYLGLKP
jgi:hypothetical protein